MNKKLYRVKFNAKLGTYVAVSELAKSHQGDTSSIESDNLETQPVTTSLWSQRYAQSERNFKKIALAISIYMAIAPVYANVAVNKSAPVAQQPTVLKAGNAANVWITAPTKSGVSRNSYTQFDVNKNGVILNNSAVAAISKITGTSLAANPQLAKGQAKTIVNEVVSTNSSFLQGNLEVLGGKANVIIANPSGITVNGGGFLNANTVTLSTGAIAYNSDGSPTQHTVKQGVITVNPDSSQYGLGGNGNNPTALELLGRSIDINAPVNASSSINIISGRNTINAADANVTNITGTGTVPTVAIDVAQLGGLYANSIYLHANESGIGVNNAGIIKAKNNIILDSNGKITNQPTGTIQTTDAANGVLAVQTNLTNAHGDILNQGNIFSANSLFVDAGRNLNLEKASQTSINNNASKGIASIEATGNIIIKDTALIKQHANNQDLYITAGQNIALTTLKAGAVSEIGSNGGIYLDAGNKLDITKTKITSKADLALSAEKAMTLKDGLLYSADKSIYLETEGGDTAASPLIVNNFILDAKQNIVIDSAGDLTATNLNLTLPSGETQTRIQDMVLQADRNLTLNQANKKFNAIQGHLNIIAAEKATLSSGMTNVTDKEIKSAKNINVKAKNIETKNVGLTGNNVELLAENTATLQNGTSIVTKTGDAVITALKGGVSVNNANITAVGKVNINANGNIQLTSHKTEQTVVGTTLKNITYTKAQVNGAKGINISSLNNQVNIDPITLNSSAGDITLLSKSNLNLNAKANEVVSKNTDGSFKSDKTYIGSNLTAKNITINSGGTLKEDKTVINANAGHLISQSEGHHDLINSTLTANKNIQLHSGKGSHLTLRGVTATAKNGHMTLSSNGQLYINSYTQEKKDSNGAVLKDTNGKTIYETNWTPKSVVNLKAAGVISLKTANAMHQLQNFNIEGGAINIESGTGMGWRGKNTIKAINSKLLADDKNLSQLNGDVSILANKHNLAISPEIISINAYGDIDIRAKDGAINLTAVSGTKGNGSEKVVNLTSATAGIYLEGTNVALQATKLTAKTDINIISTSGDIIVDGIKNILTNKIPEKNIKTLNDEKNLINKQISIYKSQAYLNDAKNINVLVEKYVRAPATEDSKYLNEIYALIGNFLSKYPVLAKTKDDYRLSISLEKVFFKDPIFPSLPRQQYDFEKSYIVHKYNANDIKLLQDKIDYLNKSPVNGFEHQGSIIHSEEGNVTIGSKQGVSISGAEIIATKGAISISSQGALKDKNGLVVQQKLNALDRNGKVITTPVSISLDGFTDFYDRGKETDINYSMRSYVKPTEMSAAKNIEIRSNGVTANDNIVLQAIGMNSTTADIIIESGKNLYVDIALEEGYEKSTSTHTSRKWYGKKKTTTTTTISSNTDSAASIFDAKGNIKIQSGGNSTFFSTGFSADKNITIKAGGNLEFLTSEEQTNFDQKSKSRSSLFGVSYNKTNTHTTRNQLTELPSKLTARIIDATTEGNAVLKGTEFNYLENASIKAKGTIEFIGAKNLYQSTYKVDSNSVVWQKMQDKGEVTETMKLPSFNGPVAPKFEAKGGLTVQVPVVAGKNNDVRAEVIKLSNQPGYDYLKQLVNRKDIDWQAVQLIQESWNYKQQGLTAAGAAILAIAIAAATGGAGASSAFGALGSTTMGHTAMTTIVTQASMSFINNGGDITKVLQDLGSKDSIKNLLVTVATAGVMDQVGGSLKVNLKDMPFAEKLANNFIQGAGSTLISTTIQGGSLSDNLQQALLSGLSTTIQAELASNIKGLEDVNYLLHKIAHAAAGCATAAIVKQCEAGAIGATVGEIAAEYFDKSITEKDLKTDQDIQNYQTKVKAYSKLIAGTVAAYTGYDVNTATLSADIAVQNNRQLNQAEQIKIQQLAANDKTKETRLGIAGCALVKCSAGYPENSLEYIYAKEMEDIGNSTAYKAERDLLTSQKIRKVGSKYAYNGFGYSGANSVIDALDRWDYVYGIGIRLEGTIQVVGGVAGGAVSGAGLSTCVTGVGCIVAFGGLAISADQIVAGGSKVVSGKNVNTLGAELISDITGLSKSQSELVYGALDLAAVTTNIRNGVLQAYKAGKISIPVVDSTKIQQQLLAKRIIENNFYKDGLNPADFMKQTYNQAALSSTHNSTSKEVILGKYILGSKSSYDEVARSRGATYFSMSDWSTVQSQLGQDKMWNINRAFLDQQIKLGKTFIFTADPKLANVGSYTQLEYKHLVNNGYTIKAISGGFYHATK